MEYSKGNYQKRLLITQLESYQDYVILITSGNGAFSYVVGDVIECVDAERPRFKIKGRTKLTLNLATEKTSVFAVEKAVLDLSNELRLFLY